MSSSYRSKWDKNLYNGISIIHITSVNDIDVIKTESPIPLNNPVTLLKRFVLVLIPKAWDPPSSTNGRFNPKQMITPCHHGGKN